MANSLLISFRKVLSPLLQHVVKQTNSILSQSARTLYCKQSLGLDGFEYQRTQIKNQMLNIENKFREKMSSFSDEESKNMIFTEDLKNMIHLSETDEDINLVIKMMKKFNQQNKELRFGSFVFGPVAMRLFHIKNQPDLALECFKSPELEGFFDQLITYQILFDLLYENQKYDEILKTFRVVQERQVAQTKYPRNVVVLTMAACYKLNSKESLKFALDLWNEFADAGHFPMRRASTFCAGLALNQGNPVAALEILSSVRNSNYTTVRNIKVAALAAVGRVDDAIPILKYVLTDDQPGPVSHTFNHDVLDAVRNAVDKLGNADVSLEYNRLENLFKKQGHISDMSLDEQLCLEIKKPPMQNREQNRFSRYEPRNNNNNNFNRRPFKPSGFRSRPGLEELQ